MGLPILRLQSSHLNFLAIRKIYQCATYDPGSSSIIPPTGVFHNVSPSCKTVKVALVRLDHRHHFQFVFLPVFLSRVST
jgi:hypothetical protein